MSKGMESRIMLTAHGLSMPACKVKIGRTTEKGEPGRYTPIVLIISIPNKSTMTSHIFPQTGVSMLFLPDVQCYYPYSSHNQGRTPTYLPVQLCPPQPYRCPGGLDGFPVEASSILLCQEQYSFYIWCPSKLSICPNQKWLLYDKLYALPRLI